MSAEVKIPLLVKDMIVSALIDEAETIFDYQVDEDELGEAFQLGTKSIVSSRDREIEICGLTAYLAAALKSLATINTETIIGYRMTPRAPAFF